MFSVSAQGKMIIIVIIATGADELDQTIVAAKTTATKYSPRTL